MRLTIMPYNIWILFSLCCLLCSILVDLLPQVVGDLDSTRVLPFVPLHLRPVPRQVCDGCACEINLIGIHLPQCSLSLPFNLKGQCGA